MVSNGFSLRDLFKELFFWLITFFHLSYFLPNFGYGSTEEQLVIEIIVCFLSRLILLKQNNLDPRLIFNLLAFG